MKTIKSVLGLALIAIMFTLGSCGKKAGNPVEEFAASINKIAQQVKSFNSENDFEKIQPEMEAADKIVIDNADYELTDNDRQTLKDALRNYYRATVSKTFEITKEEISEDQIDMIVNLGLLAIDNINTLGQLNEASGANSNLEGQETEAIGSVADKPDSLEWEKAVRLN